MNYVILNGQKSTDIQGLLIQELPMVSKPLMRTQTEEIDGRDGDIVTYLGYSAYDKEMSIGLYGDFDINDVIEYFDSQGTVIFSNEPDKFYNYQIIEQIDFERLIRFRVATVKFHVQPFKYSAVENLIDFENQFYPDTAYTQTKNGVTLTSVDNTITITGTASAATEFYVPLSQINLDAGNYVLTATANGTGCQVCSIRLINGVPSDAKSFGGTYVTLANGVAKALEAELASEASYNYLWFYITANVAMDFSFTVDLTANQLEITNTGNIQAKPIMTLYGSGTVNLSLNGNQIFAVEITNGIITIDAAQMEAYIGDILLNRYVTGDYDNLMLKMGLNVLTWTGDLTEIEIQNFSRWI